MICSWIPNNNAASGIKAQKRRAIDPIQAMAEARLPRTGSFSGVWWKLGDEASAVERRLADEEAAVKARIQRRQAGARGVRRKIASTSLGLEFLAFIYALWTARRRRMHETKPLLLLPLLAIPALATVILTAFARFQRIFDVRDQQKLQRLAAKRKAGVGQYSRGSHHNMQKLIEKYDPDQSAAAAAAADSPGQPVAPAEKLLKRTHSRLSFHVGDE